MVLNHVAAVSGLQLLVFYLVFYKVLPPILPPFLPIAAMTRDISDCETLGKSGSAVPVERRTIR